MLCKICGAEAFEFDTCRDCYWAFREPMENVEVEYECEECEEQVEEG